MTWEQKYEACVAVETEAWSIHTVAHDYRWWKDKPSPRNDNATLPADTKQTQAMCQALDPFARRLTRSISLSIVKPFSRGLRVSYWSQILTHRGQRSVCAAHFYMWFPHKNLVKSITCGTNSFLVQSALAQVYSSPHPLSLRSTWKSAPVLIYKTIPSSPLSSGLLSLLGSRSE